MAGGGAQSGKRKSKLKAPGHRAIQIVEEINFCREQIIGFRTAYEIRKQLAERYGLDERTANNRIKCAREAIKDDVALIDRQEMASAMTDMIHAGMVDAAARGQHSNVIGYIRLLGEISGITGNNRA